MRTIHNGMVDRSFHFGFVTDTRHSKNCTKHSCRCDYNDLSPSEEVPRSPQAPNLMWTPKIEDEIRVWQQTGAFPFPQIKLQSFPFQDFRIYNYRDLRLVHHLSAVYRDIMLADFVRCTLWVQQIPRFVVPCILKFVDFRSY